MANNINKLMNAVLEKENPNISDLFCLEAYLSFNNTLFVFCKNDKPVDANILFDICPEQKYLLANAKLVKDEKNIKIYNNDGNAYLVYKKDWKNFDRWKEEYIKSN